VEAWVLGKKPPSDTFQALSLFSVEQGLVQGLQRVSRKATPLASLDLFDLASVLLEEGGQGHVCFIKEARLLRRQEGIGRSYEALRHASAFATLVARNPVSEESRPAVFALLQQAFAAFSETERPEIVYFKSLYRFCRDEGYPLKQAWFPELPAHEREAAADLLNAPVAGQSIDPKTVSRLLRKMEDYLRGHTEIQLD
jgi:recombinational DNA repair protein (RecF pathway)